MTQAGTGGSLAFNVPSVTPYPNLTQIAMKYCAAGANKMLNSCK